VIDNRCLFRGGKEKTIRTAILNAGLIEAIILLPEKLFYNTGAPGAIIILNKNKPQARKEQFLFINASSEYEQHPDVRKLNRLGAENIKKVVDAYREFQNIEGFSRIVGLNEIKENDYNLNVTLYVSREEETEHIEIGDEWKELLHIEGQIEDVSRRLEGYIKELGY
jgi:type I restriction enzyme M protein